MKKDEDKLANLLHSKNCSVSHIKHSWEMFKSPVIYPMCLFFFFCGIVVLGISVTYNEQIHIGCERYNLTKTVCVFTGCLVVYASRA